ncbi:hypothetical protein [Caldimonas sp. KR1-144]|uniref:hypothetical protein n=1 Tax=Caldimonas sp. KR1-144 TaxID=3400911 RepID=UPI003C095FA5
MDMHMRLQSHQWVHRDPDWVAAGVAGLAAGAVLMVIELLWPALVGGSDSWHAARMIAAIVMGPGPLQSNGFALDVVLVALVTHYALGVLFGIALGFVIAGFRLDSSTGLVLVTGAVFGLALYLINFYGMTRVFTWFAEIRGWPMAINHVLFGMVAAWLYRFLERRLGSP